MLAFLTGILCLIILIILGFVSWNQNKIESTLTAVSVLLSTIIAVWNWRYIKESEIRNIQRNKRLAFLEDSYKQIALGVRRAPQKEYNRKFRENLEEAISVIQLYGKKELIQTLIEKYPNFDDVLNELRDSLREELGLEKVEHKIIPARSDEENKDIQEYNDSIKKS